MVMQKNDSQEEFSFKKYFVPLTTAKAITWIVIIGIIVYFNSLFGQFVFDDIPTIATNLYVHNPSNIFLVFVSPHELQNLERFYRPVSYSLYSLFYSLFGLNTFPYHLFQLIIVLANTSLVYLVLKKILKNVTAAFLLSLIFLVHPINEETVVYISYYQDVLYFFFGMSAFYLVLRVKELTLKHATVLYLLLFLSLLSKETGIIFV